MTDENATVNAKATIASKPVAVAATLSSSKVSGGAAAAKPEKARAPLSIKQQKPATSSNNATTYSFATRGSDGNLIRKSKKASGSSPIRDRDGARGVKRTHARFEELKKNTSNVRRVDPPTSNKDQSSSSSPTGSIDEVLSGKVTGTSVDSQKPRSIAYPVSPVSRSSTSTKSAPLFPDSWMFQIHEDTEEETLTNIVEFHAGNLDISDDEGGRVLSELEIKGKENIPPADYDESYSVPITASVAVTLDADRIAMPPPAAKPAPVDHKSASVGRPRSPLSSIPTSELYPESSSSSSSEKIEEKKGIEKKKEDVEMAGGSQ